MHIAVIGVDEIALPTGYRLMGLTLRNIYNKKNLQLLINQLR